MCDNMKSENRRALPKFLLSILVSLVCGGVLGFCAGWMDLGAWMEKTAQPLRDLLLAASRWGIPVTTAVLLGACLLLFLRCRRRMAAWDGEDEAAAEAVERSLNWMMLLSALQLLLDFFFFAVSLSRQDEGALRTCGAFMASMILVVLCQQKAVDLNKRLNPEKRGSVYDLNFRKKWYASCDEAERAQIGQASAHACRTASQVCIGLWLALVLLGMTVEIGLLPAVVLMIVWGVLQMSYLAECIRMSRRK